jgi:putative FmdB family regulatory protein
MPMYTFVCRDCEQPFERKLRMSQSGETQECPACGSMETRKSIGSVAIGGISRSTTRTVSAQPASSPFT